MKSSGTSTRKSGLESGPEFLVRADFAGQEVRNRPSSPSSPSFFLATARIPARSSAQEGGSVQG